MIGPRRTARRTTLLVMVSQRTAHADTIRLCDPECRDAALLDLGLSGHGGGHAFPSHGAAVVYVAWNHTEYEVTWRRCPPSALECDQCGDEWRHRPGPPRPEPRPPTAAQLRARRDFAARHRAEGKKSTGAAPAAPSAGERVDPSPRLPDRRTRPTERRPL